MTAGRSDEVFAAPPDPGRARSLDGFTERMRLLKVWAGDPSYDVIRDRVNTAWSDAGRPASEATARATVVDCFKAGRRRLNNDLVLAIVRALHPDPEYVARWRRALRVVGGEAVAAAQVHARATLPDDPPGFTGRSAELDLLRQALGRCRPPGGEADGPVVISGMAGVGKTRLAVHVAHRLVGDGHFDRVLFVNLRGFHPDPAQPPAEPAAVLGSFLHLLGVPGREIPRTTAARTTAFRDRLRGIRTLVLLDDAADEGQVRPFLPVPTGCHVLLTSRRALTDLRPTTRVQTDVFTPDEARRFLTAAVPAAPLGTDPSAPARIADRCGGLPLALGLVSGHIRSTPGWTLTDHADRLDQRHRDQRLDTGVELALGLSYQHLPDPQRRLLRLLALHPGQHLDAHAAAALAGSADLAGTRADLDHLHRDHLLHQVTPGRYALHDLVRAYAARRAGDEDRPADRRAASTRLFDHYVGAAAVAMDILRPAGGPTRPQLPRGGTTLPVPTGPGDARAWLDTERATLVSVAAHAADHGSPHHAIHLSGTLYGYLAGAHPTEGLAIHGDAHRAALRTGDRLAQGRALIHLGVTHARQAWYRPAADHLEQALCLMRQVGHRDGEALALGNLGAVEERLGRYRRAAGHTRPAFALFRELGDTLGEAIALANLGIIAGALGRFRPAATFLRRSLTRSRGIGSRSVEAWALDGLGTLHIRLRRPRRAAGYFEHALALHRETGDRDGEAWAFNGLGEATLTTGRPGAAVDRYRAALDLATTIGNRHQRARAHTGLGHAHRRLADAGQARRHYRDALTIYADLGVPQADELRAFLTALPGGR